MVSEDKIIKRGIRQTDAWFKQFKNQVEKDLSLCDTYKEFLERTEEYTTGNILVSSGYSEEMQDIITTILKDIKWKRAAQRELIEQTIKHNVGNLITNVGEDIKATVRTVVSQGYDEGIHPKEIAKNISHEIDSINHKRARTIARTEVKRADTIANYVIAKEDGATGFTIECRPDCCPVCAKEYADIENHKQGTSQYGKAIGGEKKYNITDTSILPPLHPNCRCTVYYIYDEEIPKQTSDEPATSTSATHNDNDDESKTETQVTSTPAPKPEFIDIHDSKYYFSKSAKELTIYSSQIEEVDGKYYHNGLDVTSYIDAENGWADVPESVILNFNNQFKTNEIGLQEITKKDVTLYSEFNEEYTILQNKAEEINGKYYFNGLDITPYKSDEGAWFDIPESVVDAHNKKVKEGITTETIDNEPTTSSTQAGFIDVNNNDDIIYAEATGNYLFDVDLLEKKNGKYYYNGLEMDSMHPNGQFGKVSKEHLDAYNSQFIDDSEKNLVTTPEYITVDGLVVSDWNNNNYLIDGDYVDEDEIIYNDKTGKYEYKGLELDNFEPTFNQGKVSKQKLEQHNEKVLNEATKGKELIDTIYLEEGYATGTYAIDGDVQDVKYNEETGEYEYNGLKVNEYDPDYKIGWVYAEDVEEHNQSIIDAQNNMPIIQGNGVINNKYINAMTDSLNPMKINDEIYIEDKATGKRYVYDEDAIYEKEQDRQQYRVSYNRNEKKSTEHWGKHGHQIINGLIYKVKRIDRDTGRLKQDYSYYGDDMDKLTPLYNKVQDLAVQLQNDEIGRAKYDKEIDKIFAKAEQIIDNIEDNYRATHLDVDEVRRAMWEIFDMDTAVEKSPDLLQDTFLVRFGHFNDEWCEIGKQIEFDGYTSTTYESGAADHFEDKMKDNPNRWAILIFADEGSNGVRLNNQFDALTPEREWMLARRQNFEVVDFDKTKRCAVIRLIN